MKLNLLFTTYLSILILFFLTSNVFANNDRQNDSTTLVRYYYQTGDVLNWDFSQSMDSWEGVSLNQAGRVVSIDISNNGLKHLSGLQYLDALTHLDASFNKLRKIEDELFQLTNLKELDLSYNNIVEDRFEDFITLVNLQKLHLNNNYFYGEMPKVFGVLNMLSSLKLSNNLFSGCYDTSLSSLCQLDSFSISEGNNFDADWVNFCQTNDGMCTYINKPCRQSDSLNLMAFYHKIESGLTWDVSQSIDTWEGVTLNSNGCVTALEFVGQSLKGEIAPEIGNLSQLQKLAITDNYYLSGKIPFEIGNLSNLIFLSLDGNNLIGTIPYQLGQLTNLVYLNLADNALNSRIPYKLGELTNLTYLNLCENILQGNIPSSFSNLVNLVYLNVQDNQLRGCLFKELKNLCELTSGIYLEDDDDDDNSFDASWYSFCNSDQGICAPYDPCRETDSLTLLKLYANISNLSWNLNDPIDTWQGVTLNGNGCVVSIYIHNPSNSNGQLFSEIDDFQHLEDLIISGANLSGTLPPELFNISTLKNINLSNNNLEGCFPYELFKYCEPTFSISNFDNNNFEDTWENFCNSTKGMCCRDEIENLIWTGNKALTESLYEAKNTIEAENGTILVFPYNKSAILKAGQYILLKGRFDVPNDVDFIMAIDSCK